MGILKKGVATDCVTLLVARDTQSVSEFNRLSQDFDKITPPPIASSTPLHPSPLPTATETPSSLSVMQSPLVTTTDQRNSSSSELTNITSTDISSHGEEEEEEGEGGQSLSQGGQPARFDNPVAVSDVVVTVPSPPPPHPQTNQEFAAMNGEVGSEEDDDDTPPPPLPSSLPPGAEGPPTPLPTSLPPGAEEAGTPTSAPPPLPTSPMPDEDEGELEFPEFRYQMLPISTWWLFKRI